MIEASKVRIPCDHVLIKPQAHYETYQRGGVDTGIISTNYVYEKDKKNGSMNAVKWEERNYASYGQVYAVPDKLSFLKEEIKELNRRNTIVNADGAETRMNPLLREVAELKNRSCKFKVPVEIEVGEIARFSYQAHKDAKEKGMIIDTDQGEMFFVKYDQIFFSIRQDGSIKPLNGYTVIEPIEKETERTTSSGIFIPDIAKGKGKEKRTKKALFCTVVAPGCVTTDYLERDISDPIDEINEGDILLIDPRGGIKIESDLHQQYFDRTMYLIRRHQILVNSENNANFAEIKIGYEQHSV